MNLFETLIFNFIFIICPITLYLFYVAYNKNINKNTNYLIFNLVLLTSLYLLIKFDGIKYQNIYLIMSIIPLILAYIKRDYLSISLLSILQILSYYNLFQFNIYILIVEFLIFAALSLVLSKKNISIAFFSIQWIFLILLYGEDFLDVTIITILSFILYSFMSLLIRYGEKILTYHLSLKEIEKEKQVRNSLFKIAHEIKNPMAVCKGYFDMIDLDNMDQVKKYLPIIKDEIDHTLLILQDFLSISHIKLNKDDMDINLLVEEVTNSFKPIFKNKNIDSKIDLLDDEVYIYGDYNRLKQVLINLLKNSVESINNAGSISVNTKIINNTFEVIIKDNGIGMTNEVLSHLSEPFYTTKKNGTGLGVMLSKEILKAHGANIEYLSKENMGTTALIKFPIEKNAY